MKAFHVYVIVLLTLVLDQGLKLWVKTHMILGQELEFAYWFRFYFTENEGMAYGMILPGDYGKLMLSFFRLIAVFAGTWYISRQLKNGAHWGFVTACSLILAGAIGNMIDGAIYGLIFTDSHGRLAALFPKQGYAGFLMGRVVDMLWFPIKQGNLPDWLPIWGGEYYQFFRPVFNIADAAITLGVIIIMLFQGRFFKKDSPVNTSSGSENSPTPPY